MRFRNRATSEWATVENDRAGRDGRPFDGLTLIHISDWNIAGPVGGGFRRPIPRKADPIDDWPFEEGERMGSNLNIDLGKVGGRSRDPNDSAVERYN
jgi:hypothetical protein